MLCSYSCPHLIVIIGKDAPDTKWVEVRVMLAYNAQSVSEVKVERLHFMESLLKKNRYVSLSS